jgi:hypothetical protein
MVGRVRGSLGDLPDRSASRSPSSQVDSLARVSGKARFGPQTSSWLNLLSLTALCESQDPRRLRLNSPRECGASNSTRFGPDVASWSACRAALSSLFRAS